jgi:hypothetical protein
MNKLICLHPNDNIVIVRNKIISGDREWIDGEEILFTHEIEFGHKIAKRQIRAGEKIIKYGIPIGSATTDLIIGDHIHLHNMKSDYMATYTFDKEFIYEKH